MRSTSAPLRIHLLRGAGGLGALALALRLESTSLWLSLPMLAVALWLFKGCPMCWTAALLEKLAQALLARHEALPVERPERRILPRPAARGCPGCP